jgi:ATP-dependent helicase HrpB
MLPIDSHLDDILAKLNGAQNLVLVAEPGAGKTTRLPPALLKHFSGEILVLEPRRIAAVAAADRIAEQNGWQLGHEVGYRVRFENKTDAQTRLIFMTEAILARRLLNDSELKNVDVVVLDEFHERSIHVDLALGLLRELQELRDIKIVVMSATLDAEKIAQFLSQGSAKETPIVRVPGLLHPLQIELHDKPLRPPPDASFYTVLIQKVKEAAQRNSGDILVFLPGVGEISRAKEGLSTWAQDAKIEIHILHGSLGLDDQRRALHSRGQRRIILSTNIAESSLTVDGVTAVVDGGFAKVMSQDLTTGFSRLKLSRISQSSAKQRAGRAARLTPGVCFRLWGRSEDLSLKKEDTPEILRSDLSESLLFLAATGVPNFETFSWFEKPSAVAIKKARLELIELGALSSRDENQNTITAHGQLMAQLPLAPKWAHFLLLCAHQGHLRDGCRLAALVEDRDILREGTAEAYSGDNFENDLLLRLHLLNEFESQRRERDLHAHTAKNVLRSAERLAQVTRSIVNRDSNLKTSSEKWTLEEIVLKVFSSHLCRRRGASDKALMVGRRGVKLAPASIVKTSEFFIPFQAVELTGSADTTVGLAFGFSREFIVSALKTEIEDYTELFLDEEKGRLFNRKEKRFRDLPLEEPRLSPAAAAQSEDQLADFLARNISYLTKNNEAFAHWLERWQAFTQASAVTIELPLTHALQMASVGEKKLEDIVAKDLNYFIETGLPESLVHDFRANAPATFTAPTGSKFKIHYPPNRSPYVEVRLQELFGVKENPKVFSGKIPLQFHLLGPNYRPQQVTSDIASFWQNTYPEVRKELRIRYPKHSWPENPLLAEPVKKGRSTKS